MKKPGWLDKQLKQAMAIVETLPGWMRGETDQQKSAESSNRKPSAGSKNGEAKGSKDQAPNSGDAEEK